jgi:hypothetical protein
MVHDIDDFAQEVVYMNGKRSDYLQRCLRQLVSHHQSPSAHGTAGLPVAAVPSAIA